MKNPCNSIPKSLFAPVTIFIVVLLDFITKHMIEKYVNPHEIIDVLPFLRIVNIKNSGAAFGTLSNLGNHIFISISIVAIIFIVIYLVKTSESLDVFAFSLILGGAAGNLIDRLTIGKVIDFIDFFVGKWHWPAFNVADSALTIGITLFLWSQIRQMKHH